jgi:hypothetical protein
MIRVLEKQLAKNSTLNAVKKLIDESVLEMQ